MKKIIKKWELILEEDKDKNITYSREVLNEMLTDFKQQINNLNTGDVSNFSNDVDKVIVDRNTLQWFYNYAKKSNESDETKAIIKHLESLECVY